jgi:hypothetical protein
VSVLRQGVTEPLLPVINAGYGYGFDSQNAINAALIAQIA